MILEVIAHCVIKIFIHAVRKTVKVRPDSCLTTACTSKIQRIVNVAEAELLILAAEYSLLTGMLDHILGIEAVFRIIEINSSDT